jgi:hypothetical protein
MKRDDTRLEWIEFQRLIGLFDEEPSIENYVALRRSFPRGDTEIYQLAEVDPRQAEAFQLDLEQARLTHMLVRGALSGDDRDIRAGPDRLNRIPRRLSGLLPGLVLCNFARGA